MTTLTRRNKLSLAWSILRGRLARETKEDFQYIWPFFSGGQPLWRSYDYRTLVEEGYNVNALVYEAISYKMDAKAMAPLKAWTGTADQREPADPSHPLAQLVARPNPYQSLTEFEDLAVGYLSLAGESFIALDRPDENSLPTSMFTLRPDRVHIIPNPRNAKEVLGYFYDPTGVNTPDAGIPIMFQDMMHVKRANLLDPLDGLGRGQPPVASSAHSIDVDNDVTEFLSLFFQRGAAPQGILTIDEPMDDGTITRFQDRWQEIYGNFRNWVKPLVASGKGAKYQRIGLSFDEMGFETIDERNETRILGSIGVPAVLVGARVGLKLSTNRATIEGLRKTYWEDRFIPELMRFQTEYQYYLRGDDGVFVAYDLSSVPALALNVPLLTTAAKEMWSMGVPSNQSFKAVGLKSVGDVPGGNIGYLPISLVPSGSSISVDPAPESEAPEVTDDERKAQKEFFSERAPGKKKAGWTDEQKQRLGKQVDLIAVSWEARFAAAAEKQMREDERELLALISKEKRKALEGKQTINWENVQLDWDNYFSQFADDEWRQEFIPLIHGVIADQGDFWLEATGLGLQFDLRNVPAESWFQDYMLTFAQPINTTTLDDLHLIISQALANGWTIPQMEQQLGLTFDRYLDPNFTLDGRRLTDEERQWFEDRLPRFRRENIARTETLRASNAGSHQLFVDWEVPEHEWLATIDRRTRDSHIATNGQVRNIDAAFNVGGESSAILMMHPLDTSLGAPMKEIYQCRCVDIPRFPEEP